MTINLDTQINNLAGQLLFLKGSVLNTLRFICENNIKDPMFNQQLNFYLDIYDQITKLNNIILIDNNLTGYDVKNITIDSKKAQATITYEMDK